MGGSGAKGNAVSSKQEGQSPSSTCWSLTNSTDWGSGEVGTWPAARGLCRDKDEFGAGRISENTSLCVERRWMVRISGLSRSCRSGLSSSASKEYSRISIVKYK